MRSFLEKAIGFVDGDFFHTVPAINRRSLEERIKHQGVYLPDKAKQLITEAALQALGIDDKAQEYTFKCFPFIYDAKTQELKNDELSNAIYDAYAADVNKSQVFMIQTTDIETYQSSGQAHDAILILQPRPNSKVYIELVDFIIDEPSITKAIKANLESKFRNKNISVVFKKTLGPIQSQANCSIHSAISYANYAAAINGASSKINLRSATDSSQYNQQIDAVRGALANIIIGQSEEKQTISESNNRLVELFQSNLFAKQEELLGLEKEQELPGLEKEQELPGLEKGQELPVLEKGQELPVLELGLEKEQESIKVGLFLLGLVLFAVAIVLASNVVGASTLGVFISQIVGLSIINTSGLGYAIIGFIGLFGLSLAWGSWLSAKEPSEQMESRYARSQVVDADEFHDKKQKVDDNKIATYLDDEKREQIVGLSDATKEGVSFYSHYDFKLPEMYIHESLLTPSIRAFKNSDNWVLNPHTRFVEKDGEMFLRLIQTNHPDHFSDIADAKKTGVDCEYKLEQLSTILLLDPNYIHINAWALESQDHNQTVRYCSQHECFVFRFEYQDSEYLVTNDMKSGEKQKYKKTDGNYYRRNGAQDNIDNAATWQVFEPSEELMTIFNCQNDDANQAAWDLSPS